MNAEQRRLEEARERAKHWKRWGPYLSERAWGTVREDYSAEGEAWETFPHSQSHARAYRWGEDGLAGICDRHQYICFALAFWNGKDPILKERLFGLTGNQGNHGEDVKECYYYLDSTPTHSYLKYLYKYPQAEYPYKLLVEENQRRPREAMEFELLDTGIFDEDRYFDIFVEYAKATPEDILIRLTAVNRGPEPAAVDLLPTVWFRNTWVWTGQSSQAEIRLAASVEGEQCVVIDHPYYGRRWLSFEGAPQLLFTNNETNNQLLFSTPNLNRYVKDGINQYVVHGEASAVNPAKFGTKAAARYRLELGPGQQASFRLRLRDEPPGHQAALETEAFEAIFRDRMQEADDFYSTLAGHSHSKEGHVIQRQALAGLLWSKQYYYYNVAAWLSGDSAMPKPPPIRAGGRNRNWATHMFNADVISMPDKWEYPWYATWDLAFHCVAFSLVDLDFAKEQIVLMLREWYMHPNGQLPAYEWSFDDVNPPVHAWAAWKVYQAEIDRRGKADREFLVKVFHKLLLNFTWWVNRKDAEGNNVFQGGFLGLDNIGVFDRSRPLPNGGMLEQSDGTSWMGMYCLNMLVIALELSKEDSAYSDVASKFFEHFAYITLAMNNRGGKGISLWDEQDGFYYDVLHFPNGENHHIKLRSLVGLIPLFAVEALDAGALRDFPGFLRRAQWFLENRPHLRDCAESALVDGEHVPVFLSLVNRHRLRRLLYYLLSEDEFLSPYGIRSMSRFHQDHPFRLGVDGDTHEVRYEPAESSTGLFGGNSNWRGPVWLPTNYLLIESLRKFHSYLGNDFMVEYPSGSGRMATLNEIARDLSHRLTAIFLPHDDGRRPVFGGQEKLQSCPHWKDYLLFYEYFHGDNGAGLGASHQTGWSALVANLLEQAGE